MSGNMLTREQLASMNNVPVDEVTCRMCSFCHLAKIDFDHNTCICIRWDEPVKLYSFCNHYTRQYDKVG